MPRQVRIEYTGALYHAMARGDRGEPIFHGDEDRENFLETLEETVQRTGWIIHAFVLMTNHYHLLLETPEPNLVQGMQWFQGTYTQRYNAAHRLRGHVYQGRYKAMVIDSDEKEFIDRVGTYIHLNPVRAGMVSVRKGVLRRYRWSSFPALLMTPRKRPTWLKAETVLWGAGIMKDNPSGRRKYEAYIEEQARKWKTKGGKIAFEREWASVRRGWCLGYKDFKDRLLDLLEKGLGARPSTPMTSSERKDHGEGRAEEILKMGLPILGLNPNALLRSPKALKEKRVLAWFIKKNTSTSLRWLSEALHMGHISNVSSMIRNVERDEDHTFKNLKKKVSKILKN